MLEHLLPYYFVCSYDLSFYISRLPTMISSRIFVFILFIALYFYLYKFRERVYRTVMEWNMRVPFGTLGK